MKNTMQSPYIARTFGDGTNMTKIRKYELGWPNGLSIDFHTDRLFWVDAYFDRQGFWLSKFPEIILLCM